MIGLILLVWFLHLIACFTNAFRPTQFFTSIKFVKTEKHSVLRQNSFLKCSNDATGQSDESRINDIPEVKTNTTENLSQLNSLSNETLAEMKLELQSKLKEMEIEAFSQNANINKLSDKISESGKQGYHIIQANVNNYLVSSRL
jgi:antirestriction protein ArdC